MGHLHEGMAMACSMGQDSMLGLLLSFVARGPLDAHSMLVILNPVDGFGFIGK